MNLFFLLLGLSIVLFSCKGKSRKEMKGAVEGSQRAELFPDSLLCSAETCNQEGRKLAEKGFYEEAAEWFDRAIAADSRRIIVLDPHHIKAYYRLGCLLTNQGKTEESVDCYVQALKMADTTALPEVTAAIYYNLGRLYDLHGNNVKAKQVAQEGVSRYPESKPLKELLRAVDKE